MRYNWVSVLSILFAALLCTHATPLSPHWDDMLVKHAWEAVPTNWEALGPPLPNATIDLYVALKPHHENALIDALYDVSDPMSSNYGAHLSKEQVAEIVAPHPDTLGLINSWLEHHSVPSSTVSVSHGGSWLTLTGVPVSQANALLNTSYQLYEHAKTKDRILRTLGYGLPAVLHSHVQTVAPTTYFYSPSTLRQTPRNRSGQAAAMAKSARGGSVKVLSGRDDLVTPETLRALYNTLAYVPRAADRNKLGVVGHLGDYPIQNDLTAFMREYRTDGVDATFSLVPIGNDDGVRAPHEEANLDIQYTQAIAYPTPHTFYVVDAEADEATYERWLAYMNRLTDSDIPQTISMSYSNEEHYFPRDYAKALCDQFGQLGVRGASVISSSGNEGVGEGDCIVNDGSGRVQFIPRFPASCPYVTSVGGTTSINPETAAPFSGGGFSDYFYRQKFQDNAVLSFLQKLGDQHYGLYNPFGRGFPDLAAQSDDFAFVDNGEAKTFSGTSCAVPTVAGVISLLNDYRLSINKRRLGWLNPMLYSIARRRMGGFNDITSGSNPGCNTDGFPATDGWDPVTGLGTPDFDVLVRIVELLP